jgi:DME family drug/metabolite transporter
MKPPSDVPARRSSTRPWWSSTAPSWSGGSSLPEGTPGLRPRRTTSDPHHAFGDSPPGTIRAIGLAAALGATFLFSLNGTLSTLVYDEGGDPLSMSFWRSLFGGLLLLTGMGLLRVLRGRVLFDGRRPSRRVIGWLMVGIGAVVVQNLGIYGSFQETSVLIGLVVFYSYPVMIAVASAALGLERMDARRAVALGVAFLGCVIVVLGGSGETGEIALLGVAMALIAAVAQTVYVLTARHAYGNVPALETTTVLTLGPAAVFLVLGTLAGNTNLEPASLTATLLLLYVAGAVLGQTVPMLLYLTGLRTIGPIDTAAISLIEPFAAAAVALVVVGQPFTPAQLLGGVLVAGSAFVVQRRG